MDFGTTPLAEDSPYNETIDPITDQFRRLNTSDLYLHDDEYVLPP